VVIELCDGQARTQRWTGTHTELIAGQFGFNSTLWLLGMQ